MVNWNLQPNPKLHQRQVADRIEAIRKNYETASAAADHRVVMDFLMGYHRPMLVLAALIPASLAMIVILFQ